MGDFFNSQVTVLREAERSLEEVEVADLAGWRRIEVPRYELPVYTQQKMLDYSLDLYRRNALAFRSIELTKDFLIGGGISFEAEEPLIQQIILDHWNHPENQWEARLESRIISLSLTGELLLTVNETRLGDILVGFIHPSKISGLVLDPTNEDEIKAVALTSAITLNDRQTDELEVVKYDPIAKRRKGDCFYFAINRPAPGLRGMSDLFAGIDLLYAIERFLHNRANKTAYVNAFIYDVTTRGLTEKQKAELRNDLRSDGAKPGRFFIHDENVAIDVVAPKLGGEDASADFRLLKNFLLGGFGLPEHWYGESGPGGRMVAAEMQEPVFRRLLQRQDFIRRIIKEVLELAIDAKLAHSRIERKDINTNFRVKLPRIGVRDFQRLAGAFSKATNAVLNALQSGLFTREEAREFIINLALQFNLGVEMSLKPKEEEER